MFRYRFKLREAFDTPQVRALIGYTLGYWGLTLLMGAVVQLVDDVKTARAAGHVDGYQQARRELLAELDRDDVEDQDDDDVDDDAPPPALADAADRLRDLRET